MWGEACPQLDSKLDKLGDLLLQSFHRMGETQGVCQDTLSSNAAFVGAITEYVPLWMSSLQNASVVGWSSDPSPVMLARAEFWLVIGGGVAAFFFGCLTCFLVGFKIGRSRDRPEVFLPDGRYSRVTKPESLSVNLVLFLSRVNWESLRDQGVTYRPVIGNLDPPSEPGSVEVDRSLVGGDLAPRAKTGAPVRRPVDSRSLPSSPPTASPSTKARQAARTLQTREVSADSLEGIELGRTEGKPVNAAWCAARASPSGSHLLRQRALEKEVPAKVVKPVAVRPRVEVTVVRGQEGRKVRVFPGHESHL